MPPAKDTYHHRRLVICPAMVENSRRRQSHRPLERVKKYVRSANRIQLSDHESYSTRRHRLPYCFVQQTFHKLITVAHMVTAYLTKCVDRTGRETSTGMKIKESEIWR